MDHESASDRAAEVGVVLLAAVLCGGGLSSAFASHKDMRQQLFIIAAAEFGAFTHNELMPYFLPGSELSVAACWVLAVLGGLGAGLSGLTLPRISTGICLGTLVASLLVLCFSYSIPVWGETLIFAAAIALGIRAGLVEMGLSGIAASSLFGGFLVALGVDLFVPDSALLWAFVELFQLRYDHHFRGKEAQHRGYLMPVLFVWISVAVAGFLWQSYTTKHLQRWSNYMRGYDAAGDGRPAGAAGAGGVGSGAPGAGKKSVTYRVRDARGSAGLAAGAFNLFKADRLPAALQAYAEPLKAATGQLATFFGFQRSSVQNQLEHLMVLLANKRRYEDRAAGVSAVQVLHRKTFDNYRNWCSFLRVQPNHIAERASRWEAGIVDAMIYDLVLYYCIWGEAANMRHMPEAVCFLYHKSMEDFLVHVERSLPMTERESEFFLENTVVPLFRVIKKLSKSGAVDHVDKLNYDDMNEFFWSRECLGYSYTTPGANPYVDMENGTWSSRSVSALEEVPCVADGLERASKTFVEHRSWLQQLLALWRVFEYHVLWFQFLACIALGDFLYWRWDYYLQVMSSILLTINLMPFLAELLEAMAAVGRPLDGSTVSSALLRLGARFVILVYQTVYLMWTFDGGAQEGATSLRQLGDANFWWWQYLWVSLPPLFVFLTSLVFQAYPPLLTAVLQSKSEYVQAFLAMMFPLSREFTAKVVHTSYNDTLKYSLFWFIVLAVKLGFSYYFEVMALMTPSVNLYDDYMNYPSGTQHSFALTALRIVAVWLPQFLIFLIDTNIWYAVFSSITGVVIGFDENLGEVRTYRSIRKYFMLLPNAFADKVIAEGVLREPARHATGAGTAAYGSTGSAGYGATESSSRSGSRRRMGSNSQLGSASFSPKAIGYRQTATSREDILRTANESTGLLQGAAPVDAKGETYLPPTRQRSLRRPDAVAGAPASNTKDVKSSLSEFLDARTQRWVVFAAAWNDIIHHMRQSDVLSNHEKELMTFDCFWSFSKPVYLPVFVTAGALERAVDVLRAQAEAYRSTIAAGRARRDDSFNPADEAGKHQTQILERLTDEMTWGEAASESWELASWLLVRMLGPMHEEDVIEVVSFVEALTGINPSAGGGRYMEFFALDCIKVEDVKSVLGPLQKLVGTLTKAVKKRKAKGPVAGNVTSAYPARSTLKNKKSKPADDGGAQGGTMKKSMSVSGLDGLMQLAGHNRKPSGLDATNEEADENGGHAEETPVAAAAFHLEDKDRDAVRESARALLFKIRGLICNPSVFVPGGLRAADATRRVTRLRDRITFVLKLESGFFWDDVYASSQLDSLTMDSKPAAEPVLRKLNHIITLTTQEAEPRAAEARRRLAFFVNTLFMDLPRAPRLQDMGSWSVMTPYYSEDVSYDRSDLEAKNNENLTRGVSIMLYLQKLFPWEWSNFLERTRAADDGQQVWSKDVLHETRRWASLRAQTLSRTVEGIMYYESALKLLAELEGMKGTDVDDLVRQKFTYVVSCQVYGRMRREGSSKAEDIERLMHRFPNLRIAFIDTVRIGRDGEEAFYSVLVKSDENGGVKECYRVRLPGNPVLGEGKPENQNHAVIFTRGEKLMAIDMNQDGYFEEGLKIRNLLQEFEKADKYIPGAQGDQHIAILGFREHIFTGSVSALANYMAMQETAFVSLGQRVLNRPLRMRLHYGHPDLFDKIYMSTRGGVSKASKGINLSEDIFAGYNGVVRGGQVEFKEYHTVGKGRDVGLMQTYKFEAKLSQGNAEQSLSRDLYRMAHRLDFLRLLSFYWGGIGHYLGSMLTVFTLYVLVYVEALLALYQLEKIGFRRIMPIGVIQMVLAGMGLLQTAPLLATIVIERGFLPALWEITSLTLSGSPLYFIFHIQTRAHYFVQTIMCGGAQYRATGRGFAIKHTALDEQYRFFASSHFYIGFDLLAGLVIFAVTSAGDQYAGRTWALWLCVLAFLFTPMWFNPQVYEWEKVLSDYQAWLRWQTGSSGSAAQNWSVWWTEEAAPFGRLRLTQRMALCIRPLMYLLIGYGILERYASPGSSSTPELTVGSHKLTIARLGILILALVLGYVAVDALRDSVSYGVRRGAKMILSIAFLAAVIYLVTLQTNYLTYTIALYFGFGGLAHLALLSNIATLRPLVKTCNRVHDIVLTHVLFTPIFVLAILQIPAHVQTWLLFGDALSTGVVIDDILSKARTSQLVRQSAPDKPDEDMKAAIRRLEATVNKQQRLLQHIAASDEGSRNSILASLNDGSDYGGSPDASDGAGGGSGNGAAAGPHPMTMSSAQSMVNISALAAAHENGGSTAPAPQRPAQGGTEEAKGGDFSFSQPTMMPPRF